MFEQLKEHSETENQMDHNNCEMVKTRLRRGPHKGPYLIQSEFNVLMAGVSNASTSKRHIQRLLD